MKVIYVFERRHGYIHDFESFQMASFVSKGHTVEVWSAVNWQTPGCPEPRGMDTSGRTHYINDKNSLLHEIERIKGEKCIFLVYPYHGYNHVSYIIRKSIKNVGFEFCNITEPPTLQEDFKLINSYNKFVIYFREIYRTLREMGKVFLKDPIRKLIYKGKKYGNINFNVAIKNWFFRFWGPIKYKSLYNFVTTEILYNSFPNYFEIPSKKNILLHSTVYDEYLDTKNLPHLELDDYVVYIDDYEIGHSDFIKMGLPFPVSNAEKHLKNLNNLFDEIESSLGCKVIIAAHPKAEYIGHEFNGREIIYYKTSCLIKDARLVIMGGVTTCIGNVMLYEKDYLFIYSSEYFVNLPYLKKNYDNISQWLNCSNLDIQCSEDIKQWRSYVVKYNKKIGNAYKKRFVISDGGITDKKIYDAIRDIIMGS